MKVAKFRRRFPMDGSSWTQAHVELITALRNFAITESQALIAMSYA
ncbi:MAG: hypothetical protein ACXV74_13520 [Methylobacter sp.]